MKEFFGALSFVAILQVVTWSLTILLDGFADMFGIFIWLLIIGLILYCKIDRKIIQNQKINIKKFNISLFLLWFISLFIDFFVFWNLSHEILEMFPNHTCSWFCGLGYIMLIFGRCIQFVIAGLYKIILYTYVKYKKNKKAKIVKMEEVK
ncbi:MAG: hypothetical protein IJX99_03300 [Clostridia bacterium]|nr:hypothetical protein [Clostridia bacterium]